MEGMAEKCMATKNTKMHKNILRKIAVNTMKSFD